jgi:WD40 repeat protein
MTSFAGTDLQRGAELAGYRIEALLGRGEMGVVFSPDGRYVLLGGDDRKARLWTWRAAIRYAISSAMPPHSTT